MKKILSVLVLVLISCSLFAQGAKEASEDNKIIIFQSKVEIAEALERAAADFTAETGIPVEVWQTTGDDYRAQLKMRLAGEEVPTIFSVSKGAESEMFAPYLANISSGSVQEYISDSMALVENDVRSGVPYSVEGFGFVTNENILSDADFASEDSFYAAIDKLASEGVNPVGLSQESYFLIGHILNTPFAIMDDPAAFRESFEKGEIHLADTPEFQAFATMLETIREKCLNPMEINYDKSCGDFATGKTAMIHQGNWAYTMFADYDIDFEMGLKPVPLMGNQKLSVSVPYYWVVNSQVSEAKQASAIKFLDWLYTSEKGINYILNEFAFVPATSNIPTDSLDPLSQDVAAAAASGNTLEWTFNDWPMNIVDTDIAPLAQEFFTTPDMSGLDFVNSLEDAYLARL